MFFLFASLTRMQGNQVGMVLTVHSCVHNLWNLISSEEEGKERTELWPLCLDPLCLTLSAPRRVAGPKKGITSFLREIEKRETES